MRSQKPSGLRSIPLGSRLAPALSRASALLCACAAAGCMEFDPGMEGEIELATHVTDWRREIIYQLLVDRFADGDAGNNFRVDLSAQGKYHGGDWRGLW